MAELLERAEQADVVQGAEESLPEEIAHRQKRLEKIREAKAMIKERAAKRHEAEKESYEEKMAARAAKEKRTGKKAPGRKPAPPEAGPKDKDQVNFTDPESRIMLTSSNGWQQAWNLQSCVDMNSYMILGGHITQATNDKQQLEAALQQIEALPEELGTIKRVAADAGYFSEENVNHVLDRNATPYIATGRQKHHPGWRQRLEGPDDPPKNSTPVEAMEWRLKTKRGARLLWEA